MCCPCAQLRGKGFGGFYGTVGEVGLDGTRFEVADEGSIVLK